MPLMRDGNGEIIVVDSGSTDRTIEIAQSYSAKVFVEPWKGFAAQKNAAMEKASGDWVLQLDADEALEPELADEIAVTTQNSSMQGFWIPRKNFFLGRWIRHGGFYPDAKLRLARRGKVRGIWRASNDQGKRSDGKAETRAHSQCLSNFARLH